MDNVLRAENGNRSDDTDCKFVDSPKVDHVSTVECTDTVDNSTVQSGPSTLSATEGVFHKRKTPSSQTDLHSNRSGRGHISKHRGSGGRQHYLKNLPIHSWTCSTQWLQPTVFLLVEDNNAGKSWCAGSAECVANYKSNLPIAEFVTPPVAATNRFPSGWRQQCRQIMVCRFSWVCCQLQV